METNLLIVSHPDDLSNMARIAVSQVEGEFVGAFSGSGGMFWSFHSCGFDDPPTVDDEMLALEWVLDACKNEGHVSAVLIRNVPSVVWDPGDNPMVAWELAAKHAHVIPTGIVQVLSVIEEDSILAETVLFARPAD